MGGQAGGVQQRGRAVAVGDNKVVHSNLGIVLLMLLLLLLLYLVVEGVVRPVVHSLVVRGVGHQPVVRVQVGNLWCYMLDNDVVVVVVMLV